MDIDESRSAVAARATRHRAPQALAERIGDALADAAPRSARTHGRLWQGAGAAALAAMLLAVGIGVFSTRMTADDLLADEAVANHVRSLQGAHAVDVASSDRHTVKPWFNGKLDYAAPVRDLTAEGFALEGGRLDYFDHRPVAALVYRHRLHTINVFVLPARAGEAAATRTLHRQGFAIERWTKDGMDFWAVSDADPAALAQLRALLTAPDPPP
jgi:anti-sigma factor RsiW